MYRTMLATVLLFSASALASENHVVNSQFGAGTARWTPVGAAGLTIGWNGVGHAGAGSATVYADATQTLSAHDTFYQCVGVKEFFPYTAGGWFRYDSGYDTAGHARIVVGFFASTDCTSNYLAGPSTPDSQTGPSYVDTFQVLSVTGVAPGFAKSALISLLFWTTNQGTAQGHFDDIGFVSGTSGDVNADGTRNLNDVFYLINFLFAGGPPPPGPSDVNNSDFLDVNDVFYLINYLFANGQAPQ